MTQASRRLGVSSNLGAYRLFGPQRQLAVELIATAEQHTGVGLTDYGVQARWQQPVYKDWLVGDVIVGHFWPRPDAASIRTSAWAVGAGLMMKF